MDIAYPGWVPDSAGKRQRREVKAKKAAAIEERRLARNQRRDERAAGLREPGTAIEANDDSLLPAMPADASDTSAES
jgi:hypothetical protein